MSSRSVIVLLGASNVELALPHVVEALARRVDGPFELFAAIGHGRSYGTSSRYLARELPSIEASGLWRALEGTRGTQHLAVVADVGNDLMYGASAPTIAGWIAGCLARLDALGARRVVVGLPRRRLERVTPLGFALLSTLVFPFHRRREFAATRAEARALDDRLRVLAREGAFVEPPLDWFGLDPIHVRRSMRARAFSAIAEPLGPELRPRWELSVAERRALAGFHAERRALFGRPRVHAQPQLILRDGSSLSFY
ncbi:MAG: hypothetical protein HZA53_07780 [Planctomycetes bacterium]|nr:hypothetical protein [Planctomycetota bacterium]